MLIVALIISVVSFSIVAVVYGLYFALVLKNRKTKDYLQQVEKAINKPFVFQDLPEVTVIIPMYNEQTVISKKLKNMAELNYPIKKMQILLIDDCSIDKTCPLAEEAAMDLGLNVKIIKNSARVGANASYNIGVPYATSSLVLRTDADVILNPDSLRKAVQIITEIDNVGAVTGMMNPLYNNNTAATTMEKQYRNYYDLMSITESALHSTYPGGGGFTLIRKSVFTPISVNEGSTDGNISLSIIKQGFRHIYVREDFSFEVISRRLRDQMRQKIRRARRLIQSTILFREFMFNKKYGEFGKKIFPFRFLIFVICPFFIYATIFSIFGFLLSFSPVLAAFYSAGVLILFLLGTKTKIRILNSIISVFTNQFYLLIGLFLLPKKSGTWKGVEGTKQWQAYVGNPSTDQTENHNVTV